MYLLTMELSKFIEITMGNIISTTYSSTIIHVRIVEFRCLISAAVPKTGLREVLSKQIQPTVDGLCKFRIQYFFVF